MDELLLVPFTAGRERLGLMVKVFGGGMCKDGGRGKEAFRLCQQAAVVVVVVGIDKF